MATYEELYDLGSNDALRNKIAVALSVAAEAKLSSGASTTEERTWAWAVVQNPTAKASAVLNLALAANEAATVAQIISVLDGDLQTLINGFVDALVVAHNA